MKQSKLPRILALIQALAALCVIGATQLWAPVCEKMLTLQSGGMTHMKCFYAGRAGLALGVVLLAAAIAAFFSKKDHKKIQLVVLAAGVMLFLVFTSLIGVCASEAMACRTTALWAKGCAAVLVVTGVIDLLAGQEGQVA